MLNALRNVWSDEFGSTGSEYAMLVGLVSLVAIFALTEINAQTQDLLNGQMQDFCRVVWTDIEDSARSVDTAAIP